MTDAGATDPETFADRSLFVDNGVYFLRVERTWANAIVIEARPSCRRHPDEPGELFSQSRESWTPT
jgi:hypothetical protein